VIVLVTLADTDVLTGREAVEWLAAEGPRDPEEQSTDGVGGGVQAAGSAGADGMGPTASGVEPPRLSTRRRIDLPDPTDWRGQTGAAASRRASAPREGQRQSRVRPLVVLAVDASGSMEASGWVSAVGGAILSLVADASRTRDHASVVGSRADGAEPVLSPTSGVSHAARQQSVVPTAGRSPLAADLERGLQLVSRERRGDTPLAPLLVLLTDGRPDHAERSTSRVRDALDSAERIGEHGVPAICFDRGSGPARMGIVWKLADRMAADYYRVDDLEPGEMSDIVSEASFQKRRRSGRPEGWDPRSGST
jgi:Mg-chelatase subunit ChlD